MSEEKVVTAKVFAKKALGDLIKDKKMHNIYDMEYVEAARTLAYIDDDDGDLPPGHRLVPGLSRIHWHDVDLRTLTMFFLKCVVAALPAVGLAFAIYVLTIVFMQIGPILLGV